MATKKNTVIETNGKKYEYCRITRTVGHEYKDGKKVPIKKQFLGSSKRNAEQKYRDWLAKQQPSETYNPVKTLGDLADVYVENILKVSGKYSVGTKQLYCASYVRHFKGSEVSNITLNNLKSSDIQTYYNNLQISKSSMSTLHKFLKGFFGWAEMNKQCENILKNVTVPDKESRQKQTGIVIWTNDEIDRILKSEPEYNLKPLIVTALYSGLRISELLGLRWSDISENMIHVTRQCYRGEFVPPKGNKNRDVPLHPDVKKTLANINHDYDLIFCSASGNCLDYNNTMRSIDRFYRRNNIIHKKFHAYRATFCTRLCRNGVPIQVASKLMGHSSVAITSRFYTSVSNEEMSEAVLKL